MSSSTDRWSRRNVVNAILLAGLMGTTVACAKPVSVCPVKAHTGVQQIDIFDGSPADQAFLAPNNSDKAPDVYTFDAIRDRGGFVTVRCHYNDGAAHDIKLPSGTRSCRYTEPSAANAAVSLSCR